MGREEQGLANLEEATGPKGQCVTNLKGQCVTNLKGQPSSEALRTRTEPRVTDDNALCVHRDAWVAARTHLSPTCRPLGVDVGSSGSTRLEHLARRGVAEVWGGAVKLRGPEAVEELEEFEELALLDREMTQLQQSLERAAKCLL